MKAHRGDRWQAAAEIERQGLQAASIELRWQQLNTVIGLAIGLGIMEAYNRQVQPRTCGENGSSGSEKHNRGRYLTLVNVSRTGSRFT